MGCVRSLAPLDARVLDARRSLVCSDGSGMIGRGGDEFAMEKGAVVLLLASVGACLWRPAGLTMLLELAVPELP